MPGVVFSIHRCALHIDWLDWTLAYTARLSFFTVSCYWVGTSGLWSTLHWPASLQNLMAAYWSAHCVGKGSQYEGEVESIRGVDHNSVLVSSTGTITNTAEETCVTLEKLQKETFLPTETTDQQSLWHKMADPDAWGQRMADIVQHWPNDTYSIHKPLLQHNQA